MSERRYGEDEVREILRLATTGDTREQSVSGESGGLTLDELQRIAQEVGIDPARIVQAAERFSASGQPAPARRSLGLPVGVSRVVDLPRAPTDREWEQLIAEFRATFGAQGRVTATGGLRSWSQGNLHISIEPTEHGERLRLSTLKENGLALNGLGLVMLGMSVIFSAVVAATGRPDKALAIFGLFGGMSLFTFGANLIRLPRWARTREKQMETLAQRAVKLLSGSTGPSAQ